MNRQTVHWGITKADELDDPTVRVNIKTAGSNGFGLLTKLLSDKFRAPISKLTEDYVSC